ncbi:MAG TPA: hypothetical protein ENI22_00395 [Candidatus Pacearchaeota archaeon]|nr:hypothetical protein [Candidatus Pacearchaeota archaeon]
MENENLENPKMQETYTIEVLREAREGVEKARQVCDENLAADVEETYKPLFKAGLFATLYLGARSLTPAFTGEPVSVVPENPQTLLQYTDMAASCAALMYGGCVGLVLFFVRSDSKEDRKALNEAESKLQDIVQTI